MRDGLPLPDKIKNAPILRLGLELFYNAFWDLDSCRNSGWGMGPIPWLAMRDYATTFGFTEEQEEDLYYHVRLMDNAYLDFYDKGSKPSPSQKDLGHSPGAWRSGAKRSKGKSKRR